MAFFVLVSCKHYQWFLLLTLQDEQGYLDVCTYCINTKYKYIHIRRMGMNNVCCLHLIVFFIKTSTKTINRQASVNREGNEKQEK